MNRKNRFPLLIGHFVDNCIPCIPGIIHENINATISMNRLSDEFFDIVRRVSPGPRLEMFSREGRQGFTAWGNEAGKFNVADAMSERDTTEVA